MEILKKINHTPQAYTLNNTTFFFFSIKGSYRRSWGSAKSLHIRSLLLLKDDSQLQAKETSKINQGLNFFRDNFFNRDYKKFISM